ncbi:hypothetical protein LXL04_039371 [Taraxacum kok-saghyz]
MGLSDSGEEIQMMPMGVEVYLVFIGLMDLSPRKRLSSCMSFFFLVFLFRIVKQLGMPDERIILMLADYMARIVHFPYLRSCCSRRCTDFTTLPCELKFLSNFSLVQGTFDYCQAATKCTQVLCSFYYVNMEIDDNINLLKFLICASFAVPFTKRFDN